MRLKVIETVRFAPYFSTLVFFNWMENKETWILSTFKKIQSLLFSLWGSKKPTNYSGIKGCRVPAVWVSHHFFFFSGNLQHSFKSSFQRS